MFIIYFTISVGQTANKFLVKSMEYCVETFLVKSIEYYHVPVSHSEILWIVYNLFHYFSGRNSKQVSGEINGVLRRDISGEIDRVLPCTCKSFWDIVEILWIVYNLFQYFCGRDGKQISGEINGVLHRDISGEIDGVLPHTCKSFWYIVNCL